MQKLATVFALAVAFCCNGQAQPIKQLAESYNAFGLELFSELSKTEPQRNIFISPVSLAFALAMVREGAAGQTEKEITAALHLSAMKNDEIAKGNHKLLGKLRSLDPKVTMEIANSLWIQQGAPIRPSFLNAAAYNFGAQVSTLNFSDPKSIEQINRWADKQTHGKIPTIFDEPLDPATQAALLNAIYFKGEWTKAFNKRSTQSMPFHLSDGTRHSVPMMQRHDKNFRYFQTDTFQAVGLPYGDEKVSLYIVLPATNSSIAGFTGTLTPENWNRWMKQFGNMEGTVFLPRFKFSQSFSLEKVLKKLGLSSAFDSEKADFSNLSSEPSFISRALQKTFVEVNEKGTEAAAVTAIVMRTSGIEKDPKPRFRFLADRPFFIAIRDNEMGAVWFMGAVFDPR